MQVGSNISGQDLGRSIHSSQWSVRPQAIGRLITITRLQITAVVAWPKNSILWSPFIYLQLSCGCFYFLCCDACVACGGQVWIGRHSETDTTMKRNISQQPHKINGPVFYSYRWNVKKNHEFNISVILIIENIFICTYVQQLCLYFSGADLVLWNSFSGILVERL